MTWTLPNFSPYEGTSLTKGYESDRCLASEEALTLRW